MKQDVFKGDAFGRLTVEKVLTILRLTVFVCRCSCGERVALTRRSLRLEKVRSCGCLHRDTAKKQGKRNRRHGCKALGEITPEYRAWASMKNRCLNPKDKAYYRYGGRGISVHSEWVSSFEAFLRDVGLRQRPTLSLDRINNDGNYEPGNVRWATKKEQANNRHYGNRYVRYYK